MMNSYKIATILITLCLGKLIISQGQTVSDYEGNIYQTVTIGEQVWLKENLKSRFYADGTSIEDVLAYKNASSNANIYGRLYTWQAAMNGSKQEKSQGACPNGWHVPSAGEWSQLASYLGGYHNAGGKLKESGTGHWKAPNTGASNESGFTALPAGEYDTEKFQLLHEYAVLWSSTEISGAWARYYYLSFEDSKLHPFDYDKTFYYSVRCIKNEPAGIQNPTLGGILIYPNPFDILLQIDYQQNKNSRVPAEAEIFNLAGQLIKSFTLSDDPHQEDLQSLSSGVYYLKVRQGNAVKYRKIVKK